MKTARVTIGLGANVGNCEATLRLARRLLEGRSLVAVEAASDFVLSEAMLAPGDTTPQEPYLNQVVQGITTLTPHELLAGVHAIEAHLGRDRNREQHWGPRRIDIDLLDFDGRRVEDGRLQLPHPGIAERTFVLQPWAQIAPNDRLVGDGRTIQEILDEPGRPGWVHWLTEAGQPQEGVAS